MGDGSFGKVGQRDADEEVIRGSTRSVKVYTLPWRFVALPFLSSTWSCG
jgi:hypothetical protein